MGKKKKNNKQQSSIEWKVFQLLAAEEFLGGTRKGTRAIPRLTYYSYGTFTNRFLHKQPV